jgi:hypothetical protein
MLVFPAVHWSLSPLQTARELLHSRPFQDLSHKWGELNRKMAERGDKLQQARQQKELLEQLQVHGGGGDGVGTGRTERERGGTL